MGHHFRVSASQQLSTIEDALVTHTAMRTHMEGCKVCSDSGLCLVAQPLFKDMEESRRRLKRIDFQYE